MHFLIQLRRPREVEFVLLRVCRNEREGIKCTHTLCGPGILSALTTWRTSLHARAHTQPS
jgi:hypothetical protein